MNKYKMRRLDDVLTSIYTVLYSTDIRTLYPPGQTIKSQILSSHNSNGMSAHNGRDFRGRISKIPSKKLQDFIGTRIGMTQFGIGSRGHVGGTLQSTIKGKGKTDAIGRGHGLFHSHKGGESPNIGPGQTGTAVAIDNGLQGIDGHVDTGMIGIALL